MKENHGGKKMKKINKLIRRIKKPAKTMKALLRQEKIRRNARKKILERHEQLNKLLDSGLTTEPQIKNAIALAKLIESSYKAIVSQAWLFYPFPMTPKELRFYKNTIVEMREQRKIFESRLKSLKANTN